MQTSESKKRKEKRIRLKYFLEGQNSQWRIVCFCLVVLLFVYCCFCLFIVCFLVSFAIIALTDFDRLHRLHAFDSGLFERLDIFNYEQYLKHLK